MNWKDKALYDRIIERWKEKDNDYAKVNRARDIVTRYFRTDEMLDTDDKGELAGENIYNGSGAWFSSMMAKAFQGALVSKNIPWIRYQMAEFNLRGVDELDIWVQEVKDYMSEVYQRSNFYDVQPQFTHDGITTGSPVIFGEEDVLERKTMWMPQHYKTVRVYYDKANQEEGVIVCDKTWTAKQIFDTFIKRDDENGTRRKAKLNISVNQALDSGSLNKTFTVYRAVFKITDPIWDGKDQGEVKAFKKPPGDFKWLTVYFLELTDSENNKKNKPLNDNMGDFSQPFAVWNFDKKKWDASSTTPAIYAIWDNCSLQQLDKNLLEDVQQKTRPSFMALESMRGRVDLGPEGKMFVSAEEYDKPIKFIDRVGDLQYSKDLMELKVDALKRWFYIDKFQMFTDLAMLRKQPVSASQIWQMSGEKATLLSPAIETHSRYLITTDARMVDIEVRAGHPGPFEKERMDRITDIVIRNLERLVSGPEIKPVFIGQLAQAQKVSQVLEPIMSSVGAAVDSRLFEIDPELRLMIKGYETMNDIFEGHDFPQKNIYSKDEYEERVRLNREAKAKQLQLENAIEIAKASKDVSGTVEPDSLLGAAVGATE